MLYCPTDTSNAKLNSICLLLAFLGDRPIIHVSRVRANALKYIYIYIYIYKIVKLLKINQTYNSLSNMFRFTQEPTSGSHNLYLAKITSFVQLCVSVQTSSVFWRHIVTECACVWVTVQRSRVPLCTVNHIRANQVRICRQNTDVCIDTHS